MTIDAATVTAFGTAAGAVLAGTAALVKIVLGRPRLPVAEELLEQIDELRVDVLNLARWAHRAITQAAAQGVDLEEPPEVLRSSGERHGERRSSPEATGWRSSVRAQTGEQPVTPATATGPSTQPNRRRVRPPTPPMRG